MSVYYVLNIVKVEIKTLKKGFLFAFSFIKRIYSHKNKYYKTHRIIRN